MYQLIICIQAKSLGIDIISSGIYVCTSPLNRDLKPDNILGITIYSKSEKRAGTVWKLGDFGIAKLLDARKLNNLFTSTVAGTPIYMAPEVLKGERYTDTADMWSLGGIMSFWCNVGTHLFADLGKIISWPGGKRFPNSYSGGQPLCYLEKHFIEPNLNPMVYLVNKMKKEMFFPKNVIR